MRKIVKFLRCYRNESAATVDRKRRKRKNEWASDREHRECHRVKDLQCYINECFHFGGREKRCYYFIFGSFFCCIVFFSISHQRASAIAICMQFCFKLTGYSFRPKIQTERELFEFFFSPLSIHLFPVAIMLCHFRCDLGRIWSVSIYRYDIRKHWQRPD